MGACNTGCQRPPQSYRPPVAPPVVIYRPRPPVRDPRPPARDPPELLEKNKRQKVRAPPIRPIILPSVELKRKTPPKEKKRHEHEYCSDRTPETTQRYKSTKMVRKNIETTQIVLKPVKRTFLQTVLKPDTHNCFKVTKVPKTITERQFMVK